MPKTFDFVFKGNFGYTMSGSSSSICTNAIWTPPLGEFPLNRFENSLASTLGTCNQLATTLTMLSGGQRGCLALFPPPNGQLAYSDGGPIGPFPLGTTVTLEWFVNIISHFNNFLNFISPKV